MIQQRSFVSPEVVNHTKNKGLLKYCFSSLSSAKLLWAMTALYSQAKTKHQVLLFQPIRFSSSTLFHFALSSLLFDYGKSGPLACCAGLKKSSLLCWFKKNPVLFCSFYFPTKAPRQEATVYFNYHNNKTTVRSPLFFNHRPGQAIVTRPGTSCPEDDTTEAIVKSPNVQSSKLVARTARDWTAEQPPSWDSLMPLPLTPSCQRCETHINTHVLLFSVFVLTFIRVL